MSAPLLSTVVSIYILLSISALLLSLAALSYVLLLSSSPPILSFPSLSPPVSAVLYLPAVFTATLSVLSLPHFPRMSSILVPYILASLQLLSALPDSLPYSDPGTSPQCHKLYEPELVCTPGKLYFN